MILRARDGRRLPLDPARWHGAPSAAEDALLGDLIAPVLDVGCGPGRAIEAVARRGAIAMGIDPAPGAVKLALQRGCPVLQRSVFDPLPMEGRWGTALLLDGNIGIGGDPARLLRRCGQIVHRGGQVLVEVAPPGTTSRTCQARLERGAESSAWFPWAVLAAPDVPALAEATGLGVGSLVPIDGDRWVAKLTRR